MTVYAFKKDDASELQARYDSLAAKVRKSRRNFGSILACQREARSIYERLNPDNKHGFIEDFAFKAGCKPKTCKHYNWHIKKSSALLDVTEEFTRPVSEKYARSSPEFQAKILEAYKSGDEDRIKEIEIMLDDDDKDDEAAAKKLEAKLAVDRRPRKSSSEEQADHIEKTFKSRPYVPESEDDFLEQIALNVITGAFLFDEMICTYNTSAEKIIQSIENSLMESSPKVYEDFTAQVKCMVSILAANINRVSNTAPINSNIH